MSSISISIVTDIGRIIYLSGSFCVFPAVVPSESLLAKFTIIQSVVYSLLVFAVSSHFFLTANSLSCRCSPILLFSFRCLSSSFFILLIHSNRIFSYFTRCYFFMHVFHCFFGIQLSIFFFSLFSFFLLTLYSASKLNAIDIFPDFSFLANVQYFPGAFFSFVFVFIPFLFLHSHLKFILSLPSFFFTFFPFIFIVTLIRCPLNISPSHPTLLFLHSCISFFLCFTLLFFRCFPFTLSVFQFTCKTQSQFILFLFA